MHRLAMIGSGPAGRYTAGGGWQSFGDQTRGVDVVTSRDGQAIECAEVANARMGAPRATYTAVDMMLAARDG